MHYRQVVCFVLSLFFCICAFPQVENLAGAKATAMGNAFTAYHHEYSLFHNISGTARLEKPIVLFSFENRYNLPGLSQVSGAFILPTSKGVPSISLQKFGDRYYSEQNITLGYAHFIDQISLGLQTKLFQRSIEEFNTQYTFLMNIGGMVKISKQFSFGAHVSNVNQAKIQKNYLPTIMKAGVSWTPSEKLVLNTDLFKEVNHHHSFRIGTEYVLLKNIKIRAGISTHPFVNYFGLGLHDKKINIDYAFNRHIILGYSHQVSLSFKFKTNESNPDK